MGDSFSGLNTNVVDSVFNDMMAKILSGEWKVGGKIPSENELAAQFNVSRNSLRQALNRFNALGIIESRHGDGSYIRAMDFAFYLKTIFPMVILGHYDVLNVYQLQAAIQNEAAHNLCKLAKPEQIAEMREQVQLMKRYHAQNDQQAYLMADMRFHEICVEITRNPVLISIEQCISKLLQGPLFQVSNIEQREDSILSHTKIVEAVAIGDDRSAISWMTAHMTDVVRRLELSV